MERQFKLIVNVEEFDNAVWQTKVGFNQSQFNEWLKNAADTLQDIYDTAMEESGGSAELYTLGDVINMLYNTKIIVE